MDQGEKETRRLLGTLEVAPALLTFDPNRGCASALLLDLERSSGVREACVHEKCIGRRCGAWFERENEKKNGGIYSAISIHEWKRIVRV